MPLDGSQFNMRIVNDVAQTLPHPPMTSLLKAGLTGPGAAAILKYMTPKR
jgi:hypothetical protein